MVGHGLTRQHAPAGRRGRGLKGAAALLLVLAAGTAGCASSKDVIAPAGAAGVPPSVEPPSPTVRHPVTVAPQELPPGARAQFPAYDGDALFVSLPAEPQARVTATELLGSVIVPILRSIGFQAGAAAFALPPETGVAQPRADAKRLFAAVDDGYRRKPALLRTGTRTTLASLLDKAPPDPETERMFQTIHGPSFAEIVALIERQQIHYPFRQVVGEVPIENAGLLVARWEGQSATSVSGAVLDRHAIANGRALDPSAAVGAARRALAGLKIIATSEAVVIPPELVLLPYGTDVTGVTQLRYAYRILLRAVFERHEAPFQVWIDAATGDLLKLTPLLQAVDAVGRVYNRDPGVGTLASPFAVGAATGTQYMLELPGVAGRLDFQGDGLSDVFNPADISVSESTGGSSGNLANFDQAPINDDASALCATGTNKAFQQVNVFATLMRHRETLIGSGLYTPFPAPELGLWRPQAESVGAGCGAWSDLSFGACEGYRNPACPDYVDEADPFGPQNFMNFAHDNTMVAHELGHSVNWRLTIARPSGWCGAASCPVPLGWGQFHDLADFWAAHLESTNCMGGWVAKNAGGADASLYCRLHNPGALPRLHQVRVPFDPATPKSDFDDHFPENRAISKLDYADGQIPAAFLWETRQGMQSRSPSAGVPLFGVWTVQGLRQAGFLAFTPTTSDLGTYQRLHDLATKLMDQWATGGPLAHTANKLAAGLARAGLFLIPYDCLDGSAATNANCGTKDNGGDAVIDLVDGDTSDDLRVDEVDHPENDFLRHGGPAPTFRVWTGPRYRLSGAGGASVFKNPSPCNAKFQVEVSTSPQFPSGAATILSPWRNVDTDPRTPATPECYGTWTPDAVQWATLQAGAAGTPIYYRARTRNAANGNERLSTMPGNGTWQVPPPYAVITATGAAP